MHKISRKHHILIPVILLLIVSSCMPGRRAAADFLEKKEKVAVMVVPPAYTHLFYFPFDAEENRVAFDDPQGIDKSHFLKELDIDVAAEIFMESLYDELEKYELLVFRPEKFNDFLSYDGRRYVFTIAQTEVNEYDQQMTERAMVDNVVYRQDFLLRTIERNTWFEFSVVDDDSKEEGMLVLYSNFITSDYVDGRFRYHGLSGEVNYEYESYLLTMDDVYDINRFAGVRNARYIFDFLLNRYVQKNASPFLVDPLHFTFNVRNNALRRSSPDAGFISLEPEEEPGSSE